MRQLTSCLPSTWMDVYVFKYKNFLDQDLIP